MKGRSLNVTVCELSDEPGSFRQEWSRLVTHVTDTRSDLVILPEMPFAPWFPIVPSYDPTVWSYVVAAHTAWLPHLSDLAPAAVVSSRPVDYAAGRRNEGFLWEQDIYRAVHHKYHLPNDTGFFEESWYGRGDGVFAPFMVGAAQIGMLICTEMWFFEHARRYGKEGVHLIVMPRSTDRNSLDKWLAGARSAAVVAGAYLASSNRLSEDDALATLGGRGWVIDPDGTVLGITSPEQPFLTVAVDLDVAEHARTTYPRYVKE